MRFHAEKCRVLSINHFHYNLFSELPFFLYPYQINDVLLDYRTEEKDLGIIITNKFHFTNHHHDILSKAINQFNLLRRTCHFVKNIQKRRTLYLALVRSLLDHGSQVWSPNINALNQFENFQKSCVKTKKVKRDYLHAACSVSADEFPTRWETELKNVDTLLSQLNERLHTVERLSSKFDKIDDIASNLGNFRPAAENLVKCESSDASDKGSDRVLSTPPQCPQNSLPYPLILHEQKVDVNLSDILSGCQFKESRNTEECYFGKVFYKSGNISHPPNNYPQVLPQGLVDIIEVCKTINQNFSIDNYSCVVTRFREVSAGTPYLADVDHSNIEEGSSVFTITLGANRKVECLNKTCPLNPQTFSRRRETFIR